MRPVEDELPVDTNSRSRKQPRALLGGSRRKWEAKQLKLRPILGFHGEFASPLRALGFGQAGRSAFVRKSRTFHAVREPLERYSDDGLSITLHAARPPHLVPYSLRQSPLQPLLHRAVVVLLVVCGFACCCRDRALAASWTGDEISAVVACCGACSLETAGEGSDEAAHGNRDGDGDQERGRSHPSEGCRSSCCTKAGFHAPAFELTCDRIGAPLAGTVIAEEPRASRAMPRAARFDEDVGKAPPWRLLVVSRRLRI